MAIIDELRNHWADRVLSKLQEHSWMQHPVVQQILQGVDVKTIMANCGVSNTTVHHYKNRMLRIGLRLVDPISEKPTEFSNNLGDYRLSARAYGILVEDLHITSVILLSHIPTEVIANLKIHAGAKAEILQLRKSLPNNLVAISDIESFRKYELAHANAVLNNRHQITINL